MPTPTTFAGPSAATPAWDPSQATDDGGVTADHWFRADLGTYEDDALATPAADDGDVVGSWENQNTAGDDVIQSTTASKPTLKLSILNSHPVLRFDGGDWLQAPFTSALSQPFTLFLVAKLNDGLASDGNQYLLLNSDDSSNRMQVWKTTGDDWRIFSSAVLAGGASDESWNIWSILFNGASSQFWHNGISEASGDAGIEDPDGITVGANFNNTFPWDGDIAEIIIYDSNLSNADKNQVGNYLADRYGLTWSTIS